MMWPEIMLAKRRMIRAKGFVKIPMISIGTMMNLIAPGTGGLMICPQ